MLTHVIADCKDETHQQEVSSLQLITNIQFKKKKKDALSLELPPRTTVPAHENNRPKVYHLCLSTKKLPHCAQEKGHSLLVLLVTAAANLQSAPSPPAGTSPHYSHDRGRDMLSCAWFGPAACTARPKEPMQDAWFIHCGSTGSLVFPRPCNDITCSMQRLLRFDTDGFVSRTAVAQWNSLARTVLDFVKITTRSVSQTDPELDRRMVHGMSVPNREWDCGVVAW